MNLRGLSKIGARFYIFMRVNVHAHAWYRAVPSCILTAMHTGRPEHHQELAWVMRGSSSDGGGGWGR